MRIVVIAFILLFYHLIFFLLNGSVTSQKTPNSGFAWDPRKETDQSVEMDRLAEKYLGHSQTLQFKKLPQNSSLKYQSGRVEMSISSQQYLERYGLGNPNY